MSTPDIVWVHFQVVSFLDDEATGAENLLSKLEGYDRLFALAVVRQAGEVVPCHELVHLLFVRSQLVPLREVCGVDGRMRLIIVLAFAGLVQSLLDQSVLYLRPFNCKNKTKQNKKIQAGQANTQYRPT